MAAASEKIQILKSIGGSRFLPDLPAPAAMGLQKSSGNLSLYSGSMTGCHLVIGINPKNFHEQSISHDNFFNRLSLESSVGHMCSNPDWNYYLFLTQKSLCENSCGSVAMLVDKMEKEYTNKAGRKIDFSKIFFVDDQSISCVEVEYKPRNAELIVTGRDFHSMAVTFKANIIPKPEKEAKIVKLQEFIREKFQHEGHSPGFHSWNKIPAGVQELCEADDLDSMREIARRKKDQESSYRSSATRKLYEIIADDSYSTSHAIQQEIQACCKTDTPAEGKSCRIM